MPAAMRSARKFLLATAAACAVVAAGPVAAQGAQPVARPGGAAAAPDHLRLALWQGELGRLQPLPWRLQTGAFVDLRQAAGADPRLPEATLYLTLDGGERRWQLFVRRAMTLYAADATAGIRFQASF
jgi:hypothetical protein